MTVLIPFLLLVLASVGLLLFLRWKDKQREKEQPSTEPEQPQEPVSEPKFRSGDWIQPIDEFLGDARKILEVCKYWYVTTEGTLYFEFEDNWRLWTIEEAKDGDILTPRNGHTGIFKEIFDWSHWHSYCFCDDEKFIDKAGAHDRNLTFPATKEERELLFADMAEAGYTWDAETKTLIKKEEQEEPYNPFDDFRPKPVEEPQESEKPSEPEVNDKPTLFDDLIVYFGKVVNIPKEGKTYKYLEEQYEKFADDEPDEELFTVPYYYWGDKENDCWIEQGNARLFANILSELVPDKAELLQQMGYDYPIYGADQPTYGWDFLTDPNVNRDSADIFYAANKDIDLIPELRAELGGKMVTYKNDVSELFLDNTKWMPTAPLPYLDAYKNRPKGTPVGNEETYQTDETINEYVAQYYTLDTKDAEKRQMTIQAIANKEYKKPHLFGKPRTVTDPKYGTMIFNPVFGKHNIGVEIDPNGKIADLCYSIGRICTDSRKPLLDQEYGRRRPGQGDVDPSANKVKERRALVNYAIEEGDGHTTGYYNQNGDYVDNNGTHIGDYETYFQGQLYANSYPSGHSAFIKGVAMTLADIMPDKADKILKAMVEFSNGRVICHYHNMSDVIHGRVVGGFIVPKLCACTNIDYYKRLKEAREEYLNPKPQPTEKVNTSLAYSIGGYGSCHVDAGEKEMVHKCTKQCTKERHPSIIVNQRVEFTIEGGGVTDANGKTSGVWEANIQYGIKCPSVTEDKYAYITMRNENGVKVLEYRCSKDGTHDDGAGTY